MKIKTSSTRAVQRAKALWSPSEPISNIAAGDEPLSLAWWLSQPQKEGPESPRHQAAMLFYMELAAMASPSLVHDCFPARFDFDNAKTMRPDKGTIKTFLEHGLVEGKPLVGQLVFHLTDAGRTYRDSLATKAG